MRWAAAALALGMVAGCQDKRATAPEEAGSAKATAKENRNKPEPAVQIQNEPETDKEPAGFDVTDARRTLRWIVALTEPFRVPDPKATNVAEQKKKADSALAGCLKKSVKWKIPLESITADGKLVLSPIRTGAFPDRSEKHPEITLTIRPWNYLGKESLFSGPSHSWLSTLRVGQDRLTVHGLITGISYVTLFDWYVSLAEIQISPDSGTSASIETGNRLPEKFDSEDADKAFAWLRREIYLAALPFGDRADRKKRREDLTAKFNSFAGTKIRWSWPAAVGPGDAVAVQDVAVDEYQYQMNVAMGLRLKQPKTTGKAGQARVSGSLEYDKGFFGSPGVKGVNPQVLAKIRETKKATVKGKIVKINFLYDSLDLPRAMQIAVNLDDVSIEP
jgi:hypothetical protein